MRAVIGFLWVAGLGAAACAAAEDSPTVVREVELTAADLYGGFQASRVLPADAGKGVALDRRALDLPQESRGGVIVTDPVDVAPRAGLISLGTMVRRIEVATSAATPEGAAVTVEARTGDRLFDPAAWSGWQAVAVPSGAVTSPAGRFAQLRITLSAAAADRLPSVGGVTLRAECERPAVTDAGLSVESAAVQRIVRSPVEFKYERPDQPAIRRFRDAAGLEKVVAGASGDFDRLVRLMDWTGGCRNDRARKRESGQGGYAWDIDRVFAVENGAPVIFGHCMSYAEVFVTAATALGYKARHMAVVGFREASHEVVDAWVPSLGKWAHFDPSLSTYYMDRDTCEPLNVVEVHDRVAGAFLPAGKDMRWFMQRDNAELKARVRRLGGKSAVAARLGPWSYGAAMGRDYDWGFYHGYLAYGFVQMTPRNDFHSHPEALTKNLGSYPGYAGYPFWVDGVTPPRKGVANWMTRMRDFYWTLDQASLRLETDPSGPGTLRVEFGNSMPFFARYRVTVDGADAARPANPWRWTLKPGVNRLSVAPVDELGQEGTASSVAVRYAP